MNSTPKGRVLLVEADSRLAKLFQVILTRNGYLVEWEDSSQGAIRTGATGDFDLMLLDLELPPTDGMHVLMEVKKASPRTLVVVCTSNPRVETAVQALKSGAFEYLEKPLGQDTLLQLTRRAMDLQALGAKRRAAREQLEAERRRNHDLEGRIRQQGVSERLLGTSAAMRSLHEIIGEVAETNSTVLLLGESGTGKGLVARAIHDCGPRADQPFVVANCTLYSEGVLHSELFGHEKGAFTGAVREKAGRCELAASGTLFLDEIGDLPASTQALLLRVLQERRFERVGGERSMAMHARVVAATHRVLRGRIAEGRFREDLYYRLNVIPIQVPPLRDRVEDIPILADAFLKRISTRLGKDVETFAADAMETFMAYRWPGNVRELENVVERALVLTQGSMVTRASLPQELKATDPVLTGSANDSLQTVERTHILRVLNAHDWNKKRSAAVLGINRSSLYAKLKRLGLEEAQPLETADDGPRAV